MIAITERSQAALTAMAELALAGDDVLSIPDLARRSGVSVTVLEQLLPALRRGGLVDSRRGVKGGYKLSREAAAIDALEIVEAIDGEIGLSSDKLAPWDAIVGGLRDSLAGLDLARLASDRERAAGGPMYYI